VASQVVLEIGPITTHYVRQLVERAAAGETIYALAATVGGVLAHGCSLSLPTRLDRLERGVSADMVGTGRSTSQALVSFVVKDHP